MTEKALAYDGSGTGLAKAIVPVVLAYYDRDGAFQGSQVRFFYGFCVVYDLG